jgi:hypothetical protein
MRVKKTLETALITELNVFEIITGEEVIMCKVVNYCNNRGSWDEKGKGREGDSL